MLFAYLFNDEWILINTKFLYKKSDCVSLDPTNTLVYLLSFWIWKWKQKICLNVKLSHVV